MTLALIVASGALAVGSWLRALRHKTPKSHRIVLPADVFDRFVADLDRPAQVNPRLLEAAQRFERRD